MRQQLIQEQQDHSTLSELTLDEVFSSRLNQEEYFSHAHGDVNNGKDEELSDVSGDTHIDADKVTEHKKRLQTLFKQTIAQVLAKESA